MDHETGILLMLACGLLVVMGSLVLASFVPPHTLAHLGNTQAEREAEYLRRVEWMRRSDATGFARWDDVR